MVVRLDQEWLSLNSLHKQLTRSVNNKLNTATSKLSHKASVDILWKRAWNRTGKNQGVTCANNIHALQQLINLFLWNTWAIAVDHGHNNAVKLDVNAGKTRIQLDKVTWNALALKITQQVFTSKPTDNAHGNGDLIKLIEKRRDVNTITTAVQLF